MQAEIVRNDGDLKREVWTFALSSNWSARADLYWDSYHKESRPSTRHRIWRHDSLWARTNRRDNTIDRPPLPPDVVQEAKDTFKAQIDKLEVTR